MSSDAAITVEGLGKRYRLLTRKWAGRFVEARPEAVDGDHFWALRDVAFAVAAHLDSEILLLDEALAVGDQQFRERCLTKIRDVASNGRTVMFVSHDATSVTRLCKRALLIEHGHVVFDGATEEAMRRYR